MSAQKRVGARRVDRSTRPRLKQSTRRIIIGLAAAGAVAIAVVAGTAAAGIGPIDLGGGDTGGGTVQRPSVLTPVVEGPVVAAPDRPTARFDFSVPEGEKPDLDGNGVPDLPVPRSVIHRTSFPVTLDGCPSQSPKSRITTYEWAVNFPADTVRVAGGDCRATVTAPAQGTYQVTLTVTAENGQTGTTTGKITVRDFLILSLGDSYSSGEGNPDVPAVITPLRTQNGRHGGVPLFPGVPNTGYMMEKPPVWADKACHRSWKSGPALAAVAIEKADPRTSVTFVSLACSGATIDAGLLNAYPDPPGREPGDKPIRAQVEQARQILCPAEDSRRCLPPFAGNSSEIRHVDSLILGIGGNDIGFSTVLKTCGQIDPQGPDCPNRPDLTSLVSGGMAALPMKYRILNDAVRKSLKPSQVHLTEYPDIMGDDRGVTCKKVEIIDAAGASLLNINGTINARETKWMRDEVGAPLKRIIEESAKENGWNHVNGITAASGRHGYCAKDYWLVKFEESLKRIQGDQNGAFHPNAKGHQSIASFVEKSVAGRLFSGPKPTLGNGGCEIGKKPAQPNPGEASC